MRPESAPAALPLLDAAAARAGDAAAIAAGEPAITLMERAAGHLARAVVDTGGRAYGLKVVLLVGTGNNGGDGWAAARRLTALGAQAWVVAPTGLDADASAETAANRDRWRTSGGRTSGGVADLERSLAWADVAVDALLGTGVSGPPRGPAGEALAALRTARETRGAALKIVACDVPSGVSVDDGQVPAGAVPADVTITFGGLKRGLMLHPGAAAAGRVRVGSLGPRFDPGAVAWWALTPAGAAPPTLPVDADKRARGVVLAVAGAVGTSGAAALTATGALRTGAGLVTACLPDPVRVEVAARLDPGVMVEGLPSGPDGQLAPDAVHALPDLVGVDVVVAGPGLGHGPGPSALVHHLRRHAQRLVLDADALNVHRDDPGALADHDGELVLTPHERELARIGGGADGPEALRRRVERVPVLAERYGATIVAKGPGTIVAAPDGRVWVTPVGGPGLGSGGTGDALAGIIAATVATADDVPLAVARAVWWHAAAGAVAGADRASRATATDLLERLPDVLGALAAGRDPGASIPARQRAERPRAPRPDELPWECWNAAAAVRP